MCLYPRLIQNPKYKKNKKNGGEIPAVKDHRVTIVPIGCQTCIECRQQKTREWMTRLQEDIKENKNGKFIVLTFSTENLIYITDQVQKSYAEKHEGEMMEGYELDNQIVTYAVRHFLERWRKKYKKSLRHWLVTELGHGTTEHIHIHGILWMDDVKKLDEIWQYGWTFKGKERYGKRGEITYENYVNANSISYITKYVTKIDYRHMAYRPIILTSPGIGNNYTKTGNYLKNKYNGKKTVETYRTSTGHKMAIPIYWRNKIYSDEQKEELWINKLDNHTRYVCGEKVDIKKDNKAYDKLVEYHRTRTAKLGYQPPEFLWKRKVYEEQQRELIRGRRIQEWENRKKK